MLLSNINIISQNGVKDIYLAESKIAGIVEAGTVRPSANDGINLVFENAIAFPGLINSHDHLDFNLFPQLKNRTYKNYTEWGADIHQSHKEIIARILNIPRHLRTQWGVFKNLLSGVTTVVNHGVKFENEDLSFIHQDIMSWHSISGEKQWKLKLISPFKKNNDPVVIHIGEGTDAFSSEEIDRLIKWNLFKREIIGVHGVAMNVRQAAEFEALVWCPDSNFFLLNATAKINELKRATRILFGTDSTLSATWNLWDHLRLARKTKLMTDEELFNSLTVIPAAVWKLNNRGSLAEGKIADLVIAKKIGGTDLMDNFFQLNPEDILLVIKNGKIVLADELLYSRLEGGINNFSKILVSDTAKYVKGDLPGLVSQLKRYVQELNLPIEVA
jgi:cytosine/adenosine deaminase-related metal-dependent hydrolase